MLDWLKDTEAAQLIFYGILAGLIVAEVILRYLMRVAKTNIILEYVDSGLIAVLLALVIRTLLVQAFKIPSGSMESTLLVGDHLLVNKYLYGTHVPFTNKTVLRFKDPQRGDIIVFKYPENPRRDFIKRCIGVPGDVIEIKDKELYVNSKLQIEPYVVHRDLTVLPKFIASPRDNFGPVTVPPDRYFMMGDNRDYSADSRFWGFLPRRLIEGKAWVLYWPIPRWRVVH